MFQNIPLFVKNVEGGKWCPQPKYDDSRNDEEKDKVEMCTFIALNYHVFHKVIHSVHFIAVEHCEHHC